MSFSPDGRLLATASENGLLHLWDLSRKPPDDPQRNPFFSPSSHLSLLTHNTQCIATLLPGFECVHSYSPHGGKPVNAVLFPAPKYTSRFNYVIYLVEVICFPVSCFKVLFLFVSRGKDLREDLLITGGPQNTELKLWNMRSWQLLQTISLAPPHTGAAMYNHIALDPTCSFLFVANARHTSFLILHLICTPSSPSSTSLSQSSVVDGQDSGASDDHSQEEAVSLNCMFDYLTEFAVSQPILSFTIVNRYNFLIVLQESGAIISFNVFVSYQLYGF